MWRLRLFLEKFGWKRIALAGAVIAALAAAGAVAAVVLGGDSKAASTTATREERTNLFYLRAVAPRVQVRGCSMYIRFTWRPHYQADQYIGAPALLMASGAGIQGTYERRFTESGTSLDVGPVSLAGGYQVWSARVTSLDGDPPGNDTTIHAATPTAKVDQCS